MLQHVSLETHPDQVEPALAFWGVLGFERVEAPEPIAGFVTWVERAGTQIHLLHTPTPTTPQLGHPAVVVDDFAAAVGALRGAGFEVEEAQELWGAPRAFAMMPGGHRVELMATPPPTVS
jgi:catechol 2,3-dioxygenase-like lactoylglutathione lyase family enzyme